jgi:hypothetical protein
MNQSRNGNDEGENFIERFDDSPNTKVLADFAPANTSKSPYYYQRSPI